MLGFGCQGRMLKVAGGLLVALILALMLGKYSSTGRRAHLRARHATEAAPLPGKDLLNIFWAVQVTDIHVSKFLDPLRVAEFEAFCTDSLSVIQPEIVLVTGDLTDGKTKDKLGSDQFEDEWKIYQSVLKKSQILQKNNLDRHTWEP